MKLVTFIDQDRHSFGVLTDQGIADAQQLRPDGPHSILELLRRGPSAVKDLAKAAINAASFIDPETVRLLAPIPDPPKLIALAGNYAKHIKEAGLSLGLSEAPKNDTTPRPFLMPTTAVTGPNTEIPWPTVSREIDYEVELAVVIGQTAKEIPAADAPDVIAGYTIANDISARSVTFADGRSQRPWDEFYDWLNGKWCDGFCPLGPAIVTADTIGDPADLTLELSVNGEIRQKAACREMIFHPYEIVAFVSRIMTLTPGDVICTGTPAGVGRATGNFLRSGDVITCRIDKIGELTNTLGQPPDTFNTPCKGQNR